MNEHKTVFFLKGAISTRSVKLLKLVEQFRYLGSNISSTESVVNIHIAKPWNPIDGHRSYGNLIYLIKQNEISSNLYRLPKSYTEAKYGRKQNAQRKKARQELDKNAARYF